MSERLERMLGELEERLKSSYTTCLRATADCDNAHKKIETLDVYVSSNIASLKCMIGTMREIYRLTSKGMKFNSGNVGNVGVDVGNVGVDVDIEKVEKQIIMLDEIIAKTEARDKAFSDYSKIVDEKNRILLEIMRSSQSPSNSDTDSVTDSVTA